MSTGEDRSDFQRLDSTLIMNPLANESDQRFVYMVGLAQSS